MPLFLFENVILGFRLIILHTIVQWKLVLRFNNITT